VNKLENVLGFGVQVVKKLHLEHNDFFNIAFSNVSTLQNAVFGEMFKTPPPTPQNYEKIRRILSTKKGF